MDRRLTRSGHEAADLPRYPSGHHRIEGSNRE